MQKAIARLSTVNNTPAVSFIIKPHDYKPVQGEYVVTMVPFRKEEARWLQDQISAHLRWYFGIIPPPWDEREGESMLVFTYHGLPITVITQCISVLKLMIGSERAAAAGA